MIKFGFKFKINNKLIYFWFINIFIYFVVFFISVLKIGYNFRKDKGWVFKF